MIDLKHEARNFAPMDIKGLLDKEDDFNEDIRWSYSLYNKALSFIKKGYDDMARQNLKKALGLNPDFYPARMLLGVCLFSNGDRVGAMRMFNMIRDIQYKKLAMSYYDYLTEEVDKPISQSGTRLILRDLYRVAAGSKKNVSDVTRVQPVNADESLKSQKKVNTTMGTELIEESDEKLSSPYYHKVSITELSNNEKRNVDYDMPDDDSSYDLAETSDPIASSKESEQNVITSRKNDGVVEEIIRKKMEDAQKTAIHSGSRKKPFSFSSVYSKPVFGSERSEAARVEREAFQEQGPKPEKKDNIVIAIASVFILLFLVILSVSLMLKISENRELKNDLDSIKKMYAEATVTESPSSEPTMIPNTLSPTTAPTVASSEGENNVITEGQSLDSDLQVPDE